MALGRDDFLRKITPRGVRAKGIYERRRPN